MRYTDKHVMDHQQLVRAVKRLQAGQVPRGLPPMRLETLHELAALPRPQFLICKMGAIILELDETVIKGLI